MKKYIISITIALSLHSNPASARYSIIVESQETKPAIQNSYHLSQTVSADARLRSGAVSHQSPVTHTLPGNNETSSSLTQQSVGDTLKQPGTTTTTDSLPLIKKGSAVVPFNDTLFFIYSRIASFTPEERSVNIAKRIFNIYKEPFFQPDSVQLLTTEYGTEINYNNEHVIMVVTGQDAIDYAQDEKQLATEFLEIIRKAITEQRQATSITNWLLRLGKVALIVMALGLLIYLISRLFILINKSIAANRDKFIGGVTINKIVLLSPAHLELFLLRVSGLLRIIVMLLTVYLSLPLIFSIFPETRTWTSTLLNWVLNPARDALKGVVDFLPNLFSILVIFLIFRYTIRGIKYFMEQIEKGELNISGFHSDWAQPTFRILKFLLYAFMLVLIFPYLPGSDSPAFRGVSVFLGVLFSLGSSSAISNLVAGMVITYMRPFKKGDRVKIGEITGDVIEKTMLVTRIRTVKNEDVTVPNSTVLLSSTTNYSTNTASSESGLIIHTTVTIGYDAPWKEVHKALIEAALRTDQILQNPQPFVLQISLDDFYVSYQLNGYTKEANIQARIYSQLHQNIQDCFNEAGIEIMSPHYRSQRDGNKSTIPDNYLGKDYEAPAFKVTDPTPEKRRQHN